MKAMISPLVEALFECVLIGIMGESDARRFQDTSIVRSSLRKLIYFVDFACCEQMCASKSDAHLRGVLIPVDRKDNDAG
ncbi:MAG: hypothetical protein HFJ64_08110 [Eggerthellaceae bacterium]|nr:hypothetical protein [Eggerthellaceae bacterium]